MPLMDMSKDQWRRYLALQRYIGEIERAGCRVTMIWLRSDDYHAMRRLTDCVSALWFGAIPVRIKRQIVASDGPDRLAPPMCPDVRQD